MRALVMAAGLGTRLKPLTDSTPKPLVRVGGRPMVEYVLERLGRYGIDEALINIHYFPDQMRAFVAAWNARGAAPRLEIQDESALLLDSGGSVAVAAPWLFEKDRSALVCNADVLATPDLHALVARHRALGVDCTLALTTNAEVGRKYHGVALDEAGFVRAFVNKTGTPDPSLLHFFGYYVIDAAALDQAPAAGEPFCVKQKIWKPLAARGRMGGWSYEGPYLDLGTPADITAAEAWLKAGGARS